MIKNIIEFPGLGLKFAIKETAFTLFGLQIQWYGILLTLGIICAFMLFYYLTVKVEKIPEDHILNMTLIMVPVAIIGARITYVLTSGFKYDSFIDMINIRNGGIAVYGSIIFGALTIYVYCRIKKLPFLKVLDAAALAEIVGQIIGRFGNFANGEAYGFSKNVAKLPWRMTIQEQKFKNGVWRDVGALVTAHPTFLYEILWNLLGFVIIYPFYKKKKKDGQILLMYLAWYGLGRGLIEILRTDSCTLFGVKIFVYLGLGSFVVCPILLVYLLKKAKREEAELQAYQSAYGVSPENDAEKSGLETQTVLPQTGETEETEETEETDEMEETDETEETGESDDTENEH